ncbi:MAG: hypothetical protein R3F02_16165 [Thiolinea sp.]
MDIFFHKIIKAALVVSTALLITIDIVNAEPVNDWWVGSEASSGKTFDTAMAGLNASLQKKYAQDDMLAALTEPRQPTDFVTVAEASADAPAIRQTPDLIDNQLADSSFGNQIGDGTTLDSSIAALNQHMNNQIQREIQLAAAVPPVNNASFEAVMVALALTYR